MKRLLGSVGFIVLSSTAVLAITGGCQAGASDGFGGSGTESATSGKTSSASFGTGSGEMTTGSGQVCTDPSCVGNETQGNCDAGLPLAAANAKDAAKSIGLCREFQAGGWGLVDAIWIKADGSPLGMGDGGPLGQGGDLKRGHGILPSFGSVVKPREGANMLVLSSGAARQPNDPGYEDVGGYWKDSAEHNAPPGYPKASASCSTVGGPPYDSSGLRLKIKTPTDAKSLNYNLDFYTYEFPDYVCDEYNDFFVAMLTPKPAGLPDPNISFDAQGNTISVNAGFLEVCTPQQASNGQDFACKSGPGELAGTGFDSGSNSAATGWLVTTAPITTPGDEITLDFAIWDDGDGVLDSTVLIDNFRFELNETGTGTTPIPQ